MVDGPRFLDEQAVPAPPQRDVQGGKVRDLPRGPVLLDPEPDAPASVRSDWQPEDVALPARRGLGSPGWVTLGLVVLLISWVVLSAIAFVQEMLDRSWFLGSVTILAFACSLALIARGVIAEWSGYRRLRVVDLTRAALNRQGQPPEATRAVALTWLRSIEDRFPDALAVQQAVRNAATPEEVTYILRNRVAAPLREAAMRVGRRAALQGGGLIAISPHASWDGLIAGIRGLVVIRQVASLYGLRPSLTVTVVLVRKVAWTAAGTAGLELLSNTLTDNALRSLPIAKHIAGALPGTSLAALRLYRIAGITAEACSPVRR